MTKEELEKDYYANRPIEPYSSDDCPNDWANIVQYAEENLDKSFKTIAELEKEISELKKFCDFNCPVHKLATHNACLTCPAVRNSPHHDLKNVTDEELQKIIKDAEAEMEM